MIDVDVSLNYISCHGWSWDMASTLSYNFPILSFRREATCSLLWVLSCQGFKQKADLLSSTPGLALPGANAIIHIWCSYSPVCVSLCVCVWVCVSAQQMKHVFYINTQTRTSIYNLLLNPMSSSYHDNDCVSWCWCFPELNFVSRLELRHGLHPQLQCSHT